MKNSDPPADTQQGKFIKAARALGADEDEKAFRIKLAVIGKRQTQAAGPETVRNVKRKKHDPE